MKIALLISGTPRTFFFNEQINFFKELKQKICSENNIVDIYIFLKLQDTRKYNYLISKVSIMTTLSSVNFEDRADFKANFFSFLFKLKE